jgi:hypothetical protein
MSTIPNGFSMDDLEAMLQDAPLENEAPDVSEDEPTGNIISTSKGDFTEEDILELALTCDHALFEECPHPVAHKVLILEILDKMIHWHEQTALEKDGIKACGWAADAGKLHAIKMLLLSVSLGEQDFTCK